MTANYAVTTDRQGSALPDQRLEPIGVDVRGDPLASYGNPVDLVDVKEVPRRSPPSEA